MVLSIKAVTEPDLWWQLRTGEWMLENKKVTTHDVFSYTYENVPWVNVKWGYEILQAVVAKYLGGAAMLPLLQVVITVFLLLLLLRTTGIFGRQLTNDNYKPAIGTALVIMLGLVVMEFRMTGRPEAVSHLLSAAFALLFISYRFTATKWIFLLIPLQALWANLHEAFGLGVIISVIFAAGTWFEFLFLKNSKFYTFSHEAKPQILTLAVAFSIIAISINPNGFDLLFHPLEIFSQLNRNKFTVELFSFTKKEYWTYQAYLALGMLVLTFLVLRDILQAQEGKQQPGFIFNAINKIGTGYLLFIAAMLYLTSSALRNVPFLITAILPLLAVGIDQKINQKLTATGKIKAAYFTVLAVACFFYLSVINNWYYSRFNTSSYFGFEVNAAQTPHGAASFIKKHHIKGKSFTDFLSSSYLLWYLQPGYKTYIDLRDLDIFPEIFFRNNFMLYQAPGNVFPVADEDMQFDYVVLLNDDIFRNVHQYMLTDKNFDLVYADMLASVYLRKTAGHSRIIRQFGYNNGEKDVFNEILPVSASSTGKVVTKIFNPFYKPRNYAEYNTLRYKSAYYTYLGVDIPRL